MPRTLGIIGGGRMGEAIIKGLLDSDGFGAENIIVAEPDEDRRMELRSTYGTGVTGSASEAAGVADVVIFAVKPQVLGQVLDSCSKQLDDTLVVSIAAGITTVRIESHLPPGTAVVRVMPNTPAMVGGGMSVVSAGSEARDSDVAYVVELFEGLGETIVLPESLQDAATAISGSGPAYVAVFVDALARAGVAQGLTREVAQRLAVQTIKGTAELIEATGTHPEVLVDGVASPGGTTIAALGELEKGRFRASVEAAVAAAVKRAKELGNA